MSVPINRTDPDDLLILIGKARGSMASLLPGMSVSQESVLSTTTTLANALQDCAGYIRFLETLAFQPDGDTWKELAEARGRVLAAEADWQRRKGITG